MEGIGATVLFSMAVGAGLFAVGQLLFRKKTDRNYFLALGIFCLSYVLLYFWALDTQLIRLVPLLFYSDISITFVLAPSIYLSFHRTIWDESRPVSRPWRLFVPAALVWPGLIAYNAVLSPLTPDVGTLPGHFANLPLALVSFSSDAFMFGFVLASNLEARQRCQEGGSRDCRRLRFFRVFLLGLLGASTFMFAAYVFQDESIFSLSSSCSGVLVIVYALVCTSAPGPGRSLWFGEGGRQGDTLKNLDAGRLEAKLDAYLVGEAGFRNPDLNLRTLAKALRISTQQLSQLVNDRKGVNFRTYLNSLRIRSVQEELVRCPGKTVLEVAIENGFNSKTAFNTEFSRVCGQSPREYRRAHGVDQAPK